MRFGAVSQRFAADTSRRRSNFFAARLDLTENRLRKTGNLGNASGSPAVCTRLDNNPAP